MSDKIGKPEVHENKKMRVLIVDDDPTVLDLVGKILSLTAQHDVVAASSAVSALEEIEEADQPFDACLIDIQMPEVDGIVLVKLIRETPGYQTTPIIMLTAMQDKRYLDHAFSAGATDYVGKPFEYQDLLDRLDAARTLTAESAQQSDDQAHLRRDEPNIQTVLQGIDGAIGYGELKNYVRELSRRRLFKITTFAVKVGDFEHVRDESNLEDLEALMHSIALIIKETLLDGSGVLSYRGEGAFLCIPEKPLKDAPDALQAAVNRRFNLLHPRSGRAPVHLLVGDQITLRSKTESTALETLASAIHSVETRAAQFTLAGKGPRRLFGSKWISA